MKINQIIVETTTSGAVASVAQPLGGVQKRSGNKKAGSMFKGKTTNKPFYEDQVNEEDRIIAPGKGNKVKPGLLSKPEVSMNPTDAVKLDVPLLIRLLEYAREDANSDLDLHDLAEKLVARGTRGKTLSMKDYEYVVDECKVGEGVVDTIKKGVKNIKRGLQGWEKDAEAKGFLDNRGDPKALVKRNKGYDDKTLASMSKAINGPGPGFPFRKGDLEGSDKHSPAGLQKRVVDREMKKRGLGEGPAFDKNMNDRAHSLLHKLKDTGKKLVAPVKDPILDQMKDISDTVNKRAIDAQNKKYAPKVAQEGAKVDRMVKHVSQSEKKLGHSKKEAENIAWATANKRGMLDNKNKK